MSHNHTTRQDSKLLYPNDSLKCVLLDGETVIYSEAKKGYFGVSGVAADILKISQRVRIGLRAEELIDEIANGRLLNTEDQQLILEGIATLLDLGALHEK
jgi:hypothetical protein